MKKLLLLSSMLFLGSCGNSGKTFKITNVKVAISGTAVELTSDVAIKANAITTGITLTYTNTLSAAVDGATVHNCKMTGLVLAAGTATSTTISLTGGTLAKGDVATTPPSTVNGCKTAGTVSKAAISGNAISGVDKDDVKYSNEELTIGAGTVA